MFKFLNKETFLDDSTQVIEYGEEYFNKFKQLAFTDMGYKITRFRRTYVECLANNGEILDYGTGYGDLVVKDKKNRWFGFDVNPKSKERLASQFDDNWLVYPNICMFDVLEHLQQPQKFLAELQSGVRLFISIPLWNGDWQNVEEIKTWKHFRPNEHFLYASPEGFKIFLENSGFKLIDMNQIETSLGREDVYTFAFEKC